jgi:hypothetical protein
MICSPTKLPPHKYRLSPVVFDPSWIVYKYDETANMMELKPELVVKDNILEKVDGGELDDIVYKLLPPLLQAAVITEEPSREWRWALVSFLYSALPEGFEMEPSEIVKWVMTYCPWATDWNTTTYHVNYTCRKIDYLWTKGSRRAIYPRFVHGGNA